MGSIRAWVEEACRPSGFCVRGVGVEAGPGDAVVVTGRSGSGKTTLLRAVLRLPGVKLRGRVEVRGRVGYLPQEPWRPLLGPTPRYDLLLAGAGEEGFEEVLDKPLHWLSAGWLQRLALRVALSGADVIVLDEPGVYLDEEARAALEEMVGEALQGGAAALIVDHDPARWRRLAARYIVLRDGRPACSGGEECIEEYESAPPPPQPPPGTSGAPALSMKEVWFRYPGSRGWVLEGVDVDVYEGEVVAVTGPNGAGKTTLLKLAAGIYKPCRGRVERRGDATYIPENPLLYYTGATLYEEASWGAVDGQYVEEVLRRLGLWGLRDRPLAWLSTGERRRAAIASAVTHGYSLILVDEPTAGLDPWAANRVLEVLLEAASTGAAVVMATHDRRALGSSSRTLSLRGGGR